MNRYCGLVVWYNPEEDVFDNINSYVDDVELIYIIDNSKRDQQDKIGAYAYRDKCIYICLGENKGLAKALNIGCKRAIADGFDWVLTMDQDSRFEQGAVRKLKECVENEGNQYSLVCPNVKSIYTDEKTGEEKVAYVRWSSEQRLLQNWAMTSGSLMSLEDYENVGGFDDDMFIAHLDIDLGIRFKQQGKKIIMLGDAFIRQHFGESKPKKILWKTVHPSFANPVRTYYLFRNQKYLEEKYGKEIKTFIGVSLWKFVVKITLFENKKIEKYKMMLQGYRDAKQGVMGAYRG